jgi:hypothetical protein
MEETQQEKPIIYGSGKHCYAVMMIDVDEPIDSRVELWSADDYDDLYNVIQEAFSLDDEQMEQTWGLEIRPTLIGRIR